MASASAAWGRNRITPRVACTGSRDRSAMPAPSLCRYLVHLASVLARGPTADRASRSTSDASNAVSASRPGDTPRIWREWARSVRADPYPHSSDTPRHDSRSRACDSSHAQASRTARNRPAAPRNPARRAQRSTVRRLQPARRAKSSHDSGSGNTPNSDTATAQIDGRGGSTYAARCLAARLRSSVPLRRAIGPH